MGENSAISWCDHTFNPWIGCTRVSPACDHCYAATENQRRKWVASWGEPGQPPSPRRRTKTWGEPLKWNRKAADTGYRPRVFCASLADVFDNEVPVEWRADLFNLIRRTPNLRWILLTKRIGNVLKMVSADTWRTLPHVGLMATIANQAEWDRDYHKLKAVPAAWHGVSAEPLLGPIDIGAERPDWIITGGESGPHARPMSIQWIRELRDQCAAGRVDFHFKQWGEFLPVGQSLPGCGKVHGGTAVESGRMKLHYGGTPKEGPRHAFAEHGVPFSSTDDGRLTFRVGRSRSGCLLDGVEHKAFPPQLGAS